LTIILDARYLNWKKGVRGDMMTAVVQQNPQESRPQVPPSVLLIGKKRTLDYVSPALYRINDTGELIIKATGSLSIVTAVDVAEIVKRDVPNIATQSITLGTDELRVATGELKRMSCIEIHLIKMNPIVVAQPAAEVHVPVEEPAAPPAIEIPIEAAPEVAAEVPVIVAEKKARKPRAKRKATTKKKSVKKKRKSKSA
jgi:DNA-binding protein Alba